MTTEAEVIGEVPEPKAQDHLNTTFYFPTGIYSIEKPDFLAVSKEVAEENFKKRAEESPLDEIYPAYMTGNLHTDPRMEDVAQYILATANNILISQGYNMNGLQVLFTEFWGQEHHKHSAMEQHIHGMGVQLVGFYFLECPENCSRIIIHDPRPGKVQINLPEANVEAPTLASNMINFQPKPGVLMFTNAWLAHSFSRHASEEALRFIHFNVAVQMAPQVTAAPAEVV